MSASDSLQLEPRPRLLPGNSLRACRRRLCQLAASRSRHQLSMVSAYWSTCTGHREVRMVSVLLLYALDFRRLAEPHPGQAHSGVSDGQQNLFDNPTNIQLIMNALTYLTQQLVKFNNVVASSYSMSLMSIACLLSVGHSTKLDPAAHDRTDSSTLATFRQVSPEAAAFPF